MPLLRECAAEGDCSVAGLAVIAPQRALQARAEEDEQERNQGREQEAGDLVLAPVVVPVGEGLGWRSLAARIAPRQSETDEEQQPDECSSEWQKTIETIGSHTIPLGRISATLLHERRTIFPQRKGRRGSADEPPGWCPLEPSRLVGREESCDDARHVIAATKQGCRKENAQWMQSVRRI